MNRVPQCSNLPAILPGPGDGFVPCPSVMTEEEPI
jgi:hypothetical protein